MHDGHRIRLRERFLREGLDGFEPHNVLELLLFYTIPRKDTNELAHALINEFGSLAAVFDAPYEALLRVEGVGEQTASLLRLIPQVSRRYLEEKYASGNVLDSTEKAGNFLLSKYLFQSDEIFSMLCMDSTCRLLSWEVVSKGSINATEVSIRKAIETAMKTGATSVILAHNHPGGLALPSEQDVATTRRLIEAFRLINVSVMDHIIVSEDDFVSLADSERYAALFSL